MSRAAKPHALTLAVTSGKGGVGKTNVAVNLSICLSSRGLRVVLVDVDLGLANADLLMGISPRYNIGHVVSGTQTLSQVCTKGPAGMRFVPGASGLHSLADLSELDRQSLMAQLQILENEADIVVLDCGAGLSRNVMAFALAADQVLVVTTPQPTALTDAYAIIKAMVKEKHAGRISLFVNQTRSRSQAQATYQRVGSVAKRFLNYSVADGGYMLQDTAVELAVAERCPFVVRRPQSNASACVAALADSFVQAIAGPKRRGGFFRRVVGLFV